MHHLFLFLVNVEDYMLPCFSKKYLGIDCFGCGLQRSLSLIIRGEFWEAFQMYPAIYTIILFFFLISIKMFYKFRHAQKVINILGIVNVLIIIIGFFIKKIY